MIKKIVNKSKHYWKHGKHKGMQEVMIERNRSIKKKRRGEMFGSVKDLFKKGNLT